MKKILFFTIIIAFLFIINNFFHSIYSLWQKQDLITSARSELEKQQKTHKTLEQQLETVENPTYIEEEARNKLFLGKPGEEIVVLPATPVAEKTLPQQVAKADPAWIQWYLLFF